MQYLQQPSNRKITNNIVKKSTQINLFHCKYFDSFLVEDKQD